MPTVCDARALVPLPNNQHTDRPSKYPTDDGLTSPVWRFQPRKTTSQRLKG